jgi:hypothetical protein
MHEGGPGDAACSERARKAEQHVPHELEAIADAAERNKGDRRGSTTMKTRLLMTMHVKVGTVLNIGAVPHGTRRTAPLSGGTFEGPRLRGTILADGSADWQLLRSDGVLEMDLRVTLRTDDGALISMRSFGLRHGPPEIIAAIGRGETVDPSTYYFRTMPRFETAHPAYLFLNRLIAVASGDRRPEGPIYTIHEVL